MCISDSRLNETGACLIYLPSKVKQNIFDFLEGEGLFYSFGPFHDFAEVVIPVQIPLSFL